MIEQEVKLQFDHVEAARQAVTSAGGHLVQPRRLIDDLLFDTADSKLRHSGIALRVRRDGNRAYLTFKGPVQAATVKTREELETTIGDAAILEAVLASLGFHQNFRSQKYRTDYALGEAKLTIDEAPVGIFVEIESTPEEIARATSLLGRTAADYRLESYATLWRRWCADRGLGLRDMVFDEETLPR
jgi:adenylate cyclase, class 2